MPPTDVATAAVRVGRLVLDLLLPPQCPTCDAPVVGQGQFCAACFAGINVVGHPCCRRCGAAFASAELAGADSACPQCTVRPPPWREARCALHYDGQARPLLLSFKHSDRVEHARVLGGHMARAGAELLRVADVIVPVPLHRLRLLARRYNQSALLARDVARRSAVPVLTDGLRRIRRTASLGTRSAVARTMEVAGAFVVAPGARIRHRHVLLVDDVLTSGATAGACTTALLEAGAADVDVLAAARVHITHARA